jgi:hypothetical protein
MNRNWALYPVTAIKKEHSGLQEAFEWLANNIDKSFAPVKTVEVKGI